MATDLSRRAALGAIAAGLIWPSSVRAHSGTNLYLNAYAASAGYGAAAFDADGTILYSFALPARGHGFAGRRDGSLAVVFARRPGDWAKIFEPRGGRETQTVAATQGRSFCGHGAFSADGKHLFATEVISATGDGVLGVYAADDRFRRIAEWSTGGLDPHEIILLPDDKHLAVANGGILMRAGLPRLKLNLPEMDPSLVYIDSRTGRIVRQVRPPPELHQLSIRHLAADRRGRVLIGMQYEGPDADDVPLLASHGGLENGERLRFLAVPTELNAAMNQYCGSVAIDSSGRYLAATGPRGNMALICDLDGGEVCAFGDVADICGAAASAWPGGFIFSSGIGWIDHWQGHARSLRPEQASIRWDNHISSLALTAGPAELQEPLIDPCPRGEAQPAE